MSLKTILYATAFIMLPYFFACSNGGDEPTDIFGDYGQDARMVSDAITKDTNISDTEELKDTNIPDIKEPDVLEEGDIIDIKTGEVEEIEDLRDYGIGETDGYELDILTDEGSEDTGSTQESCIFEGATRCTGHNILQVCKDGKWVDEKNCEEEGRMCENGYCTGGSSGCRLEEGTLTYCAVCGPCKEGESVCHKDTECYSGLICDNNGFCVRP
jgi:hypothetical protein